MFFKKEFKKRVKELKNVWGVQGTAGNWDYDPYMLGLFNGLEMALSLMEGREPVFRSLLENPEKRGSE